MTAVLMSGFSVAFAMQQQAKSNDTPVVLYQQQRQSYMTQIERYEKIDTVAILGGLASWATLVHLPKCLRRTRVGQAMTIGAFGSYVGSCGAILLILHKMRALRRKLADLERGL